MISMARHIDWKSKTGQIVIKPRNEEETDRFKEFKRILAKDNQTYRDYFLPYINAKIQADNPQLHFKLNGSLSKIVTAKEKLEYGMKLILCPRCKGAGCYECNGIGKIGVG